MGLERYISNNISFGKKIRYMIYSYYFLNNKIVSQNKTSKIPKQKTINDPNFEETFSSAVVYFIYLKYGL